MRPTYETEGDKHRERAVADELEKRTGNPFMEYEKFAPFDYVTYSKQYERWMMVEIKCRNIRPSYPDIWLSVSKLASIAPYIQMGFGFVYVIATEDTHYIYSTTALSTMANFPREFVSRTDRDDPQDTELAILIPKHKFKKLRRA